jgi:DNA-binding response OmpR family regulator
VKNIKKILIIEDDPSYRKLLNDQLTKNGCEIIEAEDGREGLTSALSQHPDLIILDIKMPVMDGIAMLSELRKDEYGKSAKVIILTNLEPDDKILRKVLEDLPTYYLVKSDMQLKELLEKIKEVLSPAKESK